MRHRAWFWIGGAAILIAGAFLRAYHLAAKPLWLDEAYSAYAAAGGFRFLWTVVPTYEVHPPFYYSLLRLWSLVFSDSVLGLRSLGLVCGTALIAATMLVAGQVGRGMRGRPWLMLGAGAAVAFAPSLVMMAREVRPYALMALVYALAIGALLRIGGEAGLRRRGLALFFVAQAVMLWTHNLGPLFGFALGLGLAVQLWGRRLARRDWAALAAGHVLVALCYLPALLIMLDQMREWEHSTWLRWQPGLLGRRLAGLWVTTWWPAWGVAAAFAVGGLAWMLWRAERRRMGVTLAVLALVPLGLTCLISATVTPVFIPRIMSPTIVPLAVLAAVPVAVVPGWWRVLPLALALVPLGDMGQTGWRVAKSRPRQDWNRLVQWMAPRMRAGDIVLSYPNEGALPFDRAARDAGLTVDSRPVPGPVPARLEPDSIYSTGSRGVVLLRTPRFREIARSEAVAKAPTVWLLRLGGSAYDFKDRFLTALDEADRTVVGRYRQGAIDVVVLRRDDVVRGRK
ncbi:glycosyltransferase family 39 protein [Sphingomonas sp. ID0503]|uniref:glycosyltransferase family 39 protein n=1 Tax=Sphingomonas sp. ID0503 TaxID=3399691 RepID=UPI003AFB62AD